MKTFAQFIKEDQTTEQTAPAPVTVSRNEPPSMNTARSTDAPANAAVKMKKFSEFVEAEADGR